MKMVQIDNNISIGSCGLNVIALVAFALTVTTMFGCNVSSTDKSGWTVVSTGLEANDRWTYSWCDDDHIALVTTASNGSQRQVMLVDLRTLQQTPIEMTDANGLKLRPQSPTCIDGNVFAVRTENGPNETRVGSDAEPHYLYGGKIGGNAQRLVAAKFRPLGVNFKTRYVVAQMPKIETTDGYRTDEDCASYHHPDFRLICWDTDTPLGTFFMLDHFIVAPYEWADSVAIAKDGEKPSILRNQRPPLLDKDGKIVHVRIELWDIDKKLLANLTDNNVFAIDRNNLIVTQDQRYLYAPCKKTGASRFDGDNWSACRYLLDGKENQWEEAFFFALAEKERASVWDLSICPNGDLYFVLSGARTKGVRGIWQYAPRAKTFTQITHVKGDNESDKAIKCSPDGRNIAFIRPEGGPTLFLAKVKVESK